MRGEPAYRHVHMAVHARCTHALHTHTLHTYTLHAHAIPPRGTLFKTLRPPARPRQLNVEAGQTELLKFFKNQSGERQLIIKVGRLSRILVVE
jgi:hypothetical protein